MVTVANLAAASAGAAAVLAVVLAGVALAAWNRTRSKRSLFLSAAFVVLGVQAGLTAYLLQLAANVPRAWLLVPGANMVALVLMYVALLRV